MDVIEFLPISANALLTVAGMAVAASLLIQLLKRVLNIKDPAAGDTEGLDWRLLPLIALVACIVLALAATWVKYSALTGENVLTAILVAFFGAGLAVFGYESIANLLGLMGIGTRSNDALMKQAERIAGAPVADK